MPLALGLACLAFSGGGSLAHAEVLDSVVASVGNIAITESDVEREYRVERFLDGEWPPPQADGNTLKQVRERLAYQKLLSLEEAAGRPESEELEKAAAERLQNVRQRCDNEEQFQAALQALGMNEPQLHEQLVEQQRILQLIDQHLRPAAAPGPEEVKAYYRETFAPEYARRNGRPAPPPGEVESQIRELLVQKRIDQLLAKWLEELMPSRRVRFHSF